MANLPHERVNCVTFVIPVRDDATRLQQCLSSLQALNLDGLSKEVIVADNGSSDGSGEIARQAGARVISLPKLTVAQVRNRAAALARGQLIAFVDADHLLDPQWLACGISAISEPGVGAAGAPCKAPQQPTWVQRTYDRLRARPSVRSDVEWLGSGNILVRRDAFIALGGFDENLQSCEDVDFCQRLRRAGWRVVAEPGMVSIHLGDPPSLRALFLGELWRGRDNFKVTLRGPLTVRSVASLIIPLYNLSLLAIAISSIAALPVWPASWKIAATALAVFSFLCILRALRMDRYANGIRSLFENLAVAVVYELARALALVSRATHRVRRYGR